MRLFHKILIVDDDDSVSRLLKALLSEQKGFLCTMVSTCEEAKHALKAGKFYDAVILDKQLPDAGGLECLAELLAIDAFIPIIMLTGFFDANESLRAMAKGAAGYYAKAFDIFDFELMIRQTIIRHNFRRRPKWAISFIRIVIRITKWVLTNWSKLRDLFPG